MKTLHCASTVLHPCGLNRVRLARTHFTTFTPQITYQFISHFSKFTSQLLQLNFQYSNTTSKPYELTIGEQKHDSKL